MNRVGFQHPLEIAGLLRFRWQARSLSDVRVCERSANGLASFGISHLGLEESSTNNLKGFLGRDRLPQCLHASESLFERAECGDASLTTGFNIRFRERRESPQQSDGPHFARDALAALSQSRDAEKCGCVLED
jgi:hypothetical protein